MVVAAAERGPLRLLVAFELVRSLATLLLELRGAHDGVLSLFQLAPHPREILVALLQLPFHLRNLLVVARPAAAAAVGRLLRLGPRELAFSLERALVLPLRLVSLLNRAVNLARGVAQLALPIRDLALHLAGGILRLPELHASLGGGDGRGATLLLEPLEVA